jgi:hypothetical protein
MTKKFIIEIEMVNSAFDEYPSMEVARILNTMARKIDEGDFNSPHGFEYFLFDSNGNKVGFAKLGDQ